jgi:hypothetical protein
MARDILNLLRINQILLIQYSTENTNLTIVVDPSFSVADRILSLSKIANKTSLWAQGLLSLKGIKDLKTSIMNTDHIMVNE